MMNENKIENLPGFVRNIRNIAFSISVKGADVHAMDLLLQGLETLQNALTAKEYEQREEI